MQQECLLLLHRSKSNLWGCVAEEKAARLLLRSVSGRVNEKFQQHIAPHHATIQWSNWF